MMSKFWEDDVISCANLFKKNCDVILKIFRSKDANQIIHHKIFLTKVGQVHHKT